MGDGDAAFQASFHRGIWPLCLGIPACEGGFQTRPYVTTSRSFALRRGDNAVIETIHPVISSTFTTRLDPHTLQRAFPTQHLTRLDHSFISRFLPLVAMVMSIAASASRQSLCVRC